MASSLTFVRVVTVLGLGIVLLLQGCSSLRWAGGYAGEDFQITPSYDPNEIAIDSPSYYYHTVQPGETLSSIAQRYGRTWRDLASWNNLSPPYTLEIGRKLLVTGTSNVTAYPIPPAPIVTPAPNMSSKSIRESAASYGQYVVQPGDTVYRLSQRSGYTVSQLMSWNGLATSQSLRAGQRFWLSPPNSSSSMTMKQVATPATISSPPARNSSNTHVVVGGDTVYSVARRYGNTPNQIIAWNGLTPPYRLTIGSTLRVNGSNTSPQMRSFNDSTPMVAKSSRRYHTVTRGQTVYRIAKMYGCSEYELMVSNKLSKPILRDQQKLDVSSCANSRSDATPYSSSLVAQSLPSAGNLTFHTVKSGETLESIAKMHGITLHEIALSNGIGSPYGIYPGQSLKITSR